MKENVLQLSQESRRMQGEASLMSAKRSSEALIDDLKCGNFSGAVRTDKAIKRFAEGKLLVFGA